MKMRESEIFNNYLKLAKDAGLLSDEDMKKTADDKTRYDSYSFSDIEALYGYKFDPDKEENIMEVAHPDTVTVGPSYDAMNAVVENQHQRQDIMSYVALKTPDGHLVQRRYVAASNDLIQSLVRTGFAMDSADEEDLMKLADECAGRLEKTANPLAVGLYATRVAVMSLLSSIGYLSYGSTSVQNVSANAKLVIDRAYELSGKQYAQSIIDEVSALKELADMFAQSKGAIIAKSLEEVVEKADDPKAKAMIDLIKNYKEQQQKVMKMIPKWKQVVQLSLDETQEATSDWWQKTTDMFSRITPDALQAYFQEAGAADERELLDELDALSNAITESQKTIQAVDQMASKYSGAVQKKVNEKMQKQEKPEVFQSIEQLNV